MFWTRGPNNLKNILPKREQEAVQRIIDAVADKPIGEIVQINSAYAPGSEPTVAWKESENFIVFKQYGKDHTHYGYINLQTKEVLRSTHLSPVTDEEKGGKLLDDFLKNLD